MLLFIFICVCLNSRSTLRVCTGIGNLEIRIDEKNKNFKLYIAGKWKDCSDTSISSESDYNSLIEYLASYIEENLPKQLVNSLRVKQKNMAIPYFPVQLDFQVKFRERGEAT